MLTLLCKAAIIINISGVSWNKIDETAKARAEYTCKKIYKLCLVKIIKKEVNNYHAICGEGI